MHDILDTEGYAKPVLWRIRRLPDGPRATRSGHAIEVVRRLRVDASSAAALGAYLPEKIAATAGGDAVAALEFAFTACPGAYTFSLDIPEEADSNFCVAQLDGEEIGCFAVPYLGNIDAFGRIEPLERLKRPGDMEALAEIYAQNGLNAYYDERARTPRLFRFELPVVIRQEGDHIL